MTSANFSASKEKFAIEEEYRNASDTAMKLPEDFQVLTLTELRDAVEHLTGNPGLLEMNDEQYGRYKQLVFAEDPIRYFNGARIQLTPKA